MSSSPLLGLNRDSNAVWQRISNPFAMIPEPERAACSMLCKSPIVISAVAIGAIAGGGVGAVAAGPLGGVGGACLGGIGGLILGTTIEFYRHAI